jgi:hypothetical protein
VNFQEVVHSVRAGKADVAKRQRFRESTEWTHNNARLTPSRFNTTPKTVAKWVPRFKAEGVVSFKQEVSVGLP